MKRFWMRSCFMLSSRIKAAEERAERLAKSFGVGDDE